MHPSRWVQLCSVSALVWTSGGPRTILKVPTVLLETEVERLEQRCLRDNVDRHVVLNRVQSTQDQVEERDLSGSASLYAEFSTHDAAQVPLELLDYGCERARGRVEESPTALHVLTVPAPVSASRTERGLYHPDVSGFSSIERSGSRQTWEVSLLADARAGRTLYVMSALISVGCVMCVSRSEAIPMAVEGKRDSWSPPS